MTRLNPETPPRLEPLRTAFQRAGLSPSAGYRLIKSDGFPRPIKMGRLSFVLATEVDAWIERLAAQRPTAEAP